MIRSFIKVLAVVAMVAITSGSGKPVSAESPEAVTQVGGQGARHSHFTPTGHEYCAPEVCGPAGCSNHGDHGCQDGKISKCRKCGHRGRVCRIDGYCEGCRRAGFFGRLFGIFGNNCRCEICRQGYGPGGYGNGNGHAGRHLPNGCGGKGCPPFGVYQMVYPLNPNHCDPRDGNVHAAQGYGVPMAVPLAPVVRHQYNYSWGVPASRLTPISNHAPHRMPAPAMPYGYPGQYGPGAMGPMGGPMGPGAAFPPGYCPECQAGVPGHRH